MSDCAPPLPPKTKPSPRMDSPDALTGSSNPRTVFVAAQHQRSVQPAQPNGHVVTIRINPEHQHQQQQQSEDAEAKREPINTIGKFIVNICESGDTTKINKNTSCITISVNNNNNNNQGVEALQKPGDMTGPYFFYTPSSGQCSPSDTLDSGTCSDLDGTPPPLPKKKSSSLSSKRVSVTLIGGGQAEVDSEDSESNISCDSLNSSDLSSASLHEDSGVGGFESKGPKPPAMPILDTSSSFLPQGLLKDIRDRSAKLTAPEQNKTSWAELEKNTKPEPPKIEEKLTSFKLVSQVTTKPVIVDTTPAKPIINESTYEDRKLQLQKQQLDEKNSYNFLYDTDKYYNFHLNENVFENEPSEDKKKNKSKRGVTVNGVVCNNSSDSDNGFLENEDDSTEYFAGFKDYKNEDAPSTIRSAKGTIRGVKNRVRAGIKTFLQMQDTSAKSYKEKDAGKVVVYTTSMGIVRGTYQKCVQVKKILRTLLVKFEERDVFMSGEYQEEIKDRMRSSDVLVPQIFVDGQHVGDAETIERLNESGELRRMLKPYKSADACSTCQMCGGYRLLPCPVCSGSKKSVHRNHFTAEFVALKCMNCDEVGLVKCEAC